LARQKMNDLQSARADLEALGRDYPEEIALRIALARVMVQARDEREGLAILETDWKLRPDNRMIVTTYADALLVANDSRRALKVIDDYARSRDLDAVLLKLKASALQNLNRTAESQFFLAEHYYASGALDLAIHQLTLAAKQPSNDFYNSSRIEARLQRFKEEQAERARKR
jgi:predicted Zn-dependent protease